MKYFFIAAVLCLGLGQFVYAEDQAPVNVRFVLEMPALTEKVPNQIVNKPNIPAITHAQVALSSGSATFTVSTDVPTRFSVGYRTQYLKLNNKNVQTDDFVTERAYTLAPLQPSTVYAFDLLLTDADGKKKAVGLFLKTPAIGEPDRVIDIPVKKPDTTFTLSYHEGTLSVLQGKNVTIWWTIGDKNKTVGPITCLASGSWSGNKDGSVGKHSEIIVAQTSGDYTLTCSRVDTTFTKNFHLVVTVKPQVTVSANKAEVAYDEPLTLSWTSQNATVCRRGSINSSKDGSMRVASLEKSDRDSAGSMVVTPVSSKGAGESLKQKQANYSVTCFASAQCSADPFKCSKDTYTSSSIKINVLPQRFISFLALTGKQLPTKEKEITLTWSAPRATSCVASDGWAGLKSTNGTEKVAVKGKTSFTLDCITTDGLHAQRTITSK